VGLDREDSRSRMVVSGGGTGGHLFPGIAVAEKFIATGGEVMFIGTDRMVEARVLKDRPFRVAAISAAGIKGRGAAARISAIFRLFRGFFQSLRLLRRFRPKVAMGTGGYVTVPVLMAAKILGIATLIHEQNSVPGLANRFLGRFVNRVMISMPGSEAWFEQEKTVSTGNPVRAEIISAGNSGIGREPVLLVLGGSQGAHGINLAVKQALALVAEKLPPGFTVVHQTGAADLEDVRRAYEAAGIRAEVSSFIDDMADVYRRAGLIVSRAGATTLAEICAVGRPAVLVPYPFAADDHQDKNADILCAAGAAVKIRERDLDPEELGAVIVDLMNDGEKRNRMAAASAGLARPQAAADILAECMAMMAS